LWGGPFGHGLDKNEFLLKKAQQSNDNVRLVVVGANYMFGFSFSYCVPHFKREEVFGSTKRPANYLLGVDNDFHCLDCMNFSYPRIIVPITQPNVGI
jgi:hypothetical protein